MTAPVSDPMAYRVNGCSLGVGEPHAFLHQAHAVASCLAQAAEPDLQTHRQLLQSCAEAIETLIHLAAIGLEQSDAEARAALLAAGEAR